MSEFEGKTLLQLERVLVGLISYRQGCIDSFILIEEQHERTKKFYDEKIEILQLEIEKLGNKND